MGKVFLSYSRADSLNFARELHRRLVRDGIECFFDEVSIEWGDNFVLALEKGLDDHEHVIAVLSPGFVGSDWTTVERASTTLDDPANRMGKFLPLLHLACEPPRFLKPVQYLDVTTPELFDKHYPTICRRLGGTLQPDHLLAQGIKLKPIDRWPSPEKSLDLESSFAIHEQKILELQRFKEIGVNEEVVNEFEWLVLKDWYEGKSRTQ